MLLDFGGQGIKCSFHIVGFVAQTINLIHVIAGECRFKDFDAALIFSCLPVFLILISVRVFATDFEVPRLQCDEVEQQAEAYEKLLRKDKKVKIAAYVAGAAGLFGGAYGFYQWTKNGGNETHQAEGGNGNGAANAAARLAFDPDWRYAKQYFKTLFLGALAGGCAMFVLRLIDQEVSGMWKAVKKVVFPREFILQMSIQRVSVGVKRVENMMLARRDMADFSDLRNDLIESYKWLTDGMSTMLSLLLAKANIRSKNLSERVRFRITHLIEYMNRCSCLLEDSLKRDNSAALPGEMIRLLDYVQGELVFVIEECCGES